MDMETKRKQLEAAAKSERIKIAAGNGNPNKLAALESQIKSLVGGR